MNPRYMPGSGPSERAARVMSEYRWIAEDDCLPDVEGVSLCLRYGAHLAGLRHVVPVLAQQKRYAEALGCFDAAIAVDPYFAGAWYNKALAMQCLGREKEAMAAMKTAKTLEGAGGSCRF
ncbi:MAG TPA: hypothetical protein PLN19_01060 [Methanothrix sp.]|nr:hypothetical protein [Methanothrix sp.]HOV81636.1 hypothetical protein [Methanothrix sp.]HPC88772.1 hypothetical protein [Methanothrix sp.]HQE86838.1 hypothetical protein [Methanothrix sp.]HQI68979.1 hypothetical protein [Methanothrix sp.]